MTVKSIITSAKTIKVQCELGVITAKIKILRFQKQELSK